MDVSSCTGMESELQLENAWQFFFVCLFVVVVFLVFVFVFFFFQFLLLSHIM